MVITDKIADKVTTRRANAPWSWTRLVGAESMSDPIDPTPLKSTCTVDGCESRLVARGLCGSGAEAAQVGNQSRDVLHAGRLRRQEQGARTVRSPLPALDRAWPDSRAPDGRVVGREAIPEG
jgi:hypothetical protein